MTVLYDCFVSYATAEADLAKAVAQDLRLFGLSVFMAQQALRPGQQWSRVILAALRSSDYVLFIAGDHARHSPYVLQELGGAIYGEKTVIPIVWNCSPTELPGWTREYQALDMRGLPAEEKRKLVLQLGNTIREAKRRKANAAALVAGLSLVGLLAAAQHETADPEDEWSDECD